jgi:hypothetical protein
MGVGVVWMKRQALLIALPCLVKSPHRVERYRSIERQHCIVWEMLWRLVEHAQRLIALMFVLAQ